MGQPLSSVNFQKCCPVGAAACSTSFTEQMKAQLLLRENIKALLHVRKEDASALASWLQHDKSWINKILNGHRDMQIEDFDRVADFFGIATYQLFQPGISRFTERRAGKERRAGRDRRVGHAFRLMGEHASDIESARKRLNVKRGVASDKPRRA